MFAQTILKDLSGLNVLRVIRGKSKGRTRQASPNRVEEGVVQRLFRWGFYLGLLTVLVMTGTWLVFLLYWLLPLLTIMQVIVRWGALCEHRYNLVNPKLSESTPLIVLKWWEKLLLPNLNFNYHIYHHLFPSIPGSRLPAVHRVFASYGLVDERHVFHGYLHFLRFLLTNRIEGHAAEPAPVVPETPDLTRA